MGIFLFKLQWRILKKKSNDIIKKVQDFYKSATEHIGDLNVPVLFLFFSLRDLDTIDHKDDTNRYYLQINASQIEHQKNKSIYDYFKECGSSLSLEQLGKGVQLFDETYLSTVTDTLSQVIKKIEIDYRPKMMKVNDEAFFTLNSSPEAVQNWFLNYDEGKFAHLAQFFEGFNGSDIFKLKIIQVQHILESQGDTKAVKDSILLGNSLGLQD